MFRLLRVIIRTSNELIQDYLIPSALWDLVVLTVVGAIVMWVHVYYYNVYGYLEFTLEKETNRRINFLEITICREQERFSVDIFRKPTSTDVIIPNNSCHPKEHKVPAIRYLHNRMISYQLAPENWEKEHNTILQILNNNKYDTSTLRTLNTKKGNKHREEKPKWAKFTYVGRETRAVTKIF